MQGKENAAGTPGPRLLIVGFAAQDHVFHLPALPSTGIKYRATGFAAVGGGLGANAAVAAARLGASVTFITRLGADSIGRAILDDLAAEGIDGRLARTFPGRTSPISAIMVDAAGERMLVNYADPDFPADPGWLPQHLPAETAAVMGDSRWPEGSAQLFALARASGIPAVLDADRALAGDDLLHAASHIAFSAQALREMTGCDDLAAALAGMAARTASFVAVTDGPRGLWFAGGGTVRHLPAFAVTAVDTLGAGDVFHGALTLALGEGQPVEAALRFAAGAAALKCTRFGGRAGAPTRAELDRFLAGT
jgi:sulfofructose kinase